MRFLPIDNWTDGDTCLNNNEDRAGAVLVGIFAAILCFYIVPETLKQLRQHS